MACAHFSGASTGENFLNLVPFHPCPGESHKFNRAIDPYYVPSEDCPSLSGDCSPDGSICGAEKKPPKYSAPAILCMDENPYKTPG